jgi:mannose-6-phosphate isomerase
VPAGTLHSFGPGTLVYETEQTSDVQQPAMRHRMEDGSVPDDDEWHANLDRLPRQWRPEGRPGLPVGPERPVRRAAGHDAHAVAALGDA